MRVSAIVLAAGEGSRLKNATGGHAKQFLLWRNVPLYWHSALTLSTCARLAGLVFVFPESCLEQEKRRLIELDRHSPLGVPWQVTTGGARRQDSVASGLACLARWSGVDTKHVLVHDSARPFVCAGLTNRVIDALELGENGVVPGVAVTDTIKLLDESDHVAATPERSLLRAIQTPQGFVTDTLVKAHERALREGWTVTDDAALLEKCGYSVKVVAGDAGNLKITNPEDLAMLAPAAKQAFYPCTGFGYDVHRFAGSAKNIPVRQGARPMKLGGIIIPNSPGVLAHSDGDVLLHALADALLGCCGEGDIGKLFPDTEPLNENMNSAVIVDEALTRAESRGRTITHVDLTVISQVPKINPYRDEIRANVARLLRLSPDCVNVKATTEEGLGFTGAREGIKAVAVVSALRAEKGDS